MSKLKIKVRDSELNQIYLIDTFIKEFDSSKSWYNTNSYWNNGVFMPPFKTEPNFLSKVVDKINDLNIKHYSNFNFKNVIITENNIDSIFIEIVNFIKWWNNDVKIKIKNQVKNKLKLGEIKTEQDAKNIAIKYLTDDIICYKPTTFYSDILPKTMKNTYEENSYIHPWFKNKIQNIIYEDVFGRIWNKTTGQIKDDIKLRKSKYGDYHIDELGGASWQSKDGINFICEYRTTLKDKNSKGPETFVG